PGQPGANRHGWVLRCRARPLMRHGSRGEKCHMLTCMKFPAILLLAALLLAQSAIVADPARPGSYVALGDLYARAGAQEYARSFYQAALGIDPTDAGALSAIAALDQPRNATAANGNANKPGP